MDAPLFPSGSAFNGNAFNANRISSNLYEYRSGSIKNQEKTYFVSLTRWCNENFITKKVGRNLLAKNLLIGQRLYGQWWVCANRECLQQLLDYLNLDELFFDPNGHLGIARS